MKFYSSFLFLILAFGSQAFGETAPPGQATDWHAYLKSHTPASVKWVSLYVGTDSPIEVNSDIRFRPASVQKVFSLAAYRAWIGMDRRIPPTLKHSENEMAVELARELGKKLSKDGSNSDEVGISIIQKHAESLISAALKRHPLLQRKETRVLTEFTGVFAFKDPFQIVCRSPSGESGLDDSWQPGVYYDTSLVSAQTTGLYLEELQHKKYFSDILRSLPYAGGTKDSGGTLSGRMNSPKDFAKGRVAAKTGTLGTISNLAGYLHTSAKDAAGKAQSNYIPFVIFIKHEYSEVSQQAAHQLADQMTNRLAQDLKATPIAAPSF